MKLFRRRFLQLAAAGAALPAVSRIANSQSYPSRPVRLIVGFPAGGGTDTVARLIANWLSERIGQRVIVENRPGAATNIATEFVVNAPPDGYTLLLATGANAINATLYEGLNFNFIRDTAPVGLLVRVPNVMIVGSTVPADSLTAFIAYSKASPGKVNMATAGKGSPPHIYGELFQMMTGISLVPVPYRGDAPAITDMLGGAVQFYITTVPGAIGYIRAGKLRALGVTTAERLLELPDVPTVREFVPGYEAVGWQGIVAPKGTPVEILETLSKEINSGLNDPKLAARFADLGAQVHPGSRSNFGKLIADETEKWANVIHAANIKPD
jgi:tripartite-type tricarboxylate transporter receptor subunit TctC